MKSIAILAALGVLCGAEAAAAATAKTAPRRLWAHAASARLHKASRTTHRRRAGQHMLTAVTPARAATDAPHRVYRASDDETLPAHPGWFRSEREKEAGWGVNDRGTHAVVGIYQRPPEPGMPGPQTYHTPEGRGAAGLSLSFKLGQ